MHSRPPISSIDALMMDQAKEDGSGARNSPPPSYRAGKSPAIVIEKSVPSSVPYIVDIRDRAAYCPTPNVPRAPQPDSSRDSGYGSTTGSWGHLGFPYGMPRFYKLP